RRTSSLIAFQLLDSRLFDQLVDPLQVCLRMQKSAPDQPGQVVAIFPASSLLQPIQIAHTLQIAAPLAGEQRTQVAVGEAAGEEELHIEVLAQLLRSGLGLDQPGVERGPTLVGEPISQLAPVAAGAHRTYQPVALQPLEGRVDLADVDLPASAEHGLEAGFQLVAM